MLTHLQRLEADSIHIMREAVAESERPVMLYSVGKDSAVLLHLAMKAFYPAKPPFPLLMADAGLLVLVSFISPFRAERDAARALVDAGEFVEVFVDTPLRVAEGRDRKGLYRKARAGNLPHFTGIDSPYEPPPAPEVRITPPSGGHMTSSVEESVEQIVGQLRAQGILP